MKRKIAWLLAATIPFTMLGACGKSDTTGPDTDLSADAGSKTDSTGSIQTDYGTVTLCDYKNLSAEKQIMEVSESDIDDQVDSYLYEYIEYPEVTDRGAEEEDYVAVSMTLLSEDGEELESYTKEDDYEIYLGDEEYGKEFDDQLTGTKPGDSKEFSVTYDEDDEEAYYPGETIQFQITVDAIYDEVYPELTEEFIKDTLGFDSEEDMRQTAKEELEAENESDSLLELKENLIQQVIDNSTFEDYSDELYESCYASDEEGYAGYMDLFGVGSVEEIYDMFGMTDEDLEKEAQDQMFRLIAVNALADAEQISMSDEEYNEGLERYALENDYDSTDELLEDYTEDTMRSWIFEDLVLDMLVDYATITEVTVPSDTEE